MWGCYINFELMGLSVFLPKINKADAKVLLDDFKLKFNEALTANTEINDKDILSSLSTQITFCNKARNFFNEALYPNHLIACLLMDKDKFSFSNTPKFVVIVE